MNSATDHSNTIELGNEVTNDTSGSPVSCSCVSDVNLSKNQKDEYKNVANIVYDLSQFMIQNIFILDNKKNIIMDGKFTKIIYSDHFFISHGIFLLVDLLLDGIQDNNLRNEFVQPTREPPGFVSNSEVRNTKEILSKPKIMNSSDGSTKHRNAKEFVTKDKNFAYNGGLKFFVKLQPKIQINEKTVNRLIGIEYSILEFYKNIYNCTKRSMTILKNQLLNGLIKIHHKNDKIRGTNFSVSKRFVLKISGIWEDSENIGLTYRFMYD